MGSTKHQLVDLISLSESKNSDSKFTLDNLRGISIKKRFIQTKADMEGVSLKSYLVVPPDFFAYVTITSRNGEKITIAHNDTNDTYIVSSSYIVFSVIRPDILDSNYLFMYFNRPEFDRYSRFCSWGSAREAFTWDEMCGIKINLPDLPIQKKYADVFKSMGNSESYRHFLDVICPILIKGSIEEASA